MLSWQEVADFIAKMTPDERTKPAFCLDDNTGELNGFSHIESGEGRGLYLTMALDDEE